MNKKDKTKNLRLQTQNQRHDPFLPCASVFETKVLLPKKEKKRKEWWESGVAVSDVRAEGDRDHAAVLHVGLVVRVLADVLKGPDGTTRRNVC